MQPLQAARGTPLGPIATQLGLFVPVVLAGTVITETVFNYPGMGLLFWNAATARDYPVELGVVLVIAIAAVVGSLLADVAYALLGVVSGGIFDSPLVATLIATAQNDMLHVEAEKYASSLIDAGVHTQVVRYPSVSHAALADHPPALQEAVRFFQWRFDARAHRST